MAQLLVKVILLSWTLIFIFNSFSSSIKKHAKWDTYVTVLTILIALYMVHMSFDVADHLEVYMLCLFIWCSWATFKFLTNYMGTVLRVFIFQRSSINRGVAAKLLHIFQMTLWNWDMTALVCYLWPLLTVRSGDPYSVSPLSLIIILIGLFFYSFRGVKLFCLSFL